MPTKAWIKGYLAYGAKVVVGDNPYAEETNEHWEWMAGWAAAGMEKLKGKP